MLPRFNFFPGKEGKFSNKNVFYVFVRVSEGSERRYKIPRAYVDGVCFDSFLKTSRHSLTGLTGSKEATKAESLQIL